MDEILKYLKTNIDDNTSLVNWNAKDYLNVQLAGSYEYYLVNALAEDFLLVKPLEEISIQKISIQTMRIKEKTGYNVAILLQKPSSYIIKKMLEERNAFITVDKQMYLPFMAIHLKQSSAKKNEIEDRDKFTAATQLIFLYMLYTEQESFGVEELTKKLGVSSMTVNRTMTMFEQIGLVSSKITGQTGRKKLYILSERKNYFQIGKKYLINPVQKSIYVKEVPENVKVYKAGITALGEQTMLAEPKNQVVATSNKQANHLANIVTKEQALTDGLPEMQIMKYDIGKLTKNEYVDSISLIMSIKTKDDRTEIAIDELMKGTLWYEE